MFVILACKYQEQTTYMIINLLLRNFCEYIFKTFAIYHFVVRLSRHKLCKLIIVITISFKVEAIVTNIISLK